MTSHRTRITAATAFAAGTLIAITGCAMPTADNTNPSGNPSNSASNLNASDAAAVIAGSTVMSEVPSTTPDAGAVKEFTAKLDATKKDPAKPAVDMGYKGAVLVDYQMTDKGVAGPVCIVTQAPSGASPAPIQSTWATYFDPDIPNEANTAALIVGPGVADCTQAKTILDGIKADAEKRRQASLISTNLVKDAYTAVPVTSLTERGLAVLDLLRSGQTAASPAATPTK